jgi:hypothetical protein
MLRSFAQEFAAVSFEVVDEVPALHAETLMVSRITSTPASSFLASERFASSTMIPPVTGV